MKKNTNTVRNAAGRPVMNASQRRGYADAEYFAKKYAKAMKVLGRQLDY